jgi:aminopeptidase YwaD
MKPIFLSLLLLHGIVFGQKMKKSDRAILESLKANIDYLADDKLEGRRAGTPGEGLAMNYIADQFTKAGLQPRGDNNGFVQAFNIDDGRAIKPSSIFSRWAIAPTRD